VVTEELKRATQDGGTRRLARLGEQLIRMKASVVVPAFLKDTQLLGFLVLGQKRSGQMFTSDDLRTFNALAHQAAIAVQNARFYRHGLTLSKLEAAQEQLSAIGHEMGNVLHIATVQAGTLKDALQRCARDVSPEKMINALTRMEKALLRGGFLIGDLKQYQRAASEKGLQVCPMPQFFQEAARILQQRFEDCPNIRVALDFPANLPPVEGLPTLPLLPLHLLAIPFWGISVCEGGGTIAVSGRLNDQRHGLDLMVADDATEPLAPYLENPNRVTEDIFPTRSRHGAFYYFIAKKIVSDHHGRLTVHDGPGPLLEKPTNGSAAVKGTTMIVHLPLHYTPPKREEIEEEPLGNPP
jgi:signal transduction histidine kinase